MFSTKTFTLKCTHHNFNNWWSRIRRWYLYIYILDLQKTIRAVNLSNALVRNFRAWILDTIWYKTLFGLFLSISPLHLTSYSYHCPLISVCIQTNQHSQKAACNYYTIRSVRITFGNATVWATKILDQVKTCQSLDLNFV